MLIPSATSIRQLEAQVRGCQICTLNRTRIQAVPGTGHPNPPLMLVGEGPGEQEDSLGYPFIGPSGDLLDEALAAASLTRDMVYITNVLKCRCYGISETGAILNQPPTDRITELSTCVTRWLQLEMSLIDPCAILAVGTTAVQVLLGQKTVGGAAGRWHPQNRFGPVPVRATRHPAYVLRSDGDTYERNKAQLFEDVREARDMATSMLAQRQKA